MSQFYKLTIADIKKETSDTVSLAFELTNDQKSVFSYIPGQYLTLSFIINGNDQRRAYSICSSMNSDELIRVAVKKVDNGLVSTHVNEKLNVGDVVDVMPPQGNFTIDLNNNHKKRYVAFAAGSGITPIMSMIKSVLSVEPNSVFHLFYGNKNPEATIFKENIDSMISSNLNVNYIYSRYAEAEQLYSGRLDAQKVNLLLRDNLECLKADHFFLCGPEQMIFDVSNTLKNFDVKEEKIHFELFTTPVLMASETKEVEIDTDFDGNSSVTVICDDEEVIFDLSADGDTILDAAMENDVDVPFSCKGAVCCTCKAKVVSGKVNMDANYALSDQEVEDGFVLACQAHPASSKVIVDFD